MFKVAENRKYPRMTIDCGITYRGVEVAGRESRTGAGPGGMEAGEERQGVAKNISGNGLMFLADEPLAVGSFIEVKIQPGTLSIPPFKAIVEVVRVDATVAAEEGRYGIAASIHSLVK